MIQHFQKETLHAENEKMHYRKIETFMLSASTISHLGISLITSIISAYFVIRSFISVGTMVAITQLVNNVANPLYEISIGLTKMKSTNTIQLHLQEVIKKKESLSTNKPYHKIIDITSITCDHITFAYDQVPAISDFTFQFEKGKKYAIVGLSGSGKSTLLKLLMGYDTVTLGSIKINGYPIEEIDKASYYRSTAMIQQEVFIFEDTLEANICLYEPYNPKNLQLAIQQANLDTFLQKHPNGLQTALTEAGKQLSGGERQRIAVARAFVKNSSLLFADEATASLDKESAYAIESALIQKTNCTCIVVTHDLHSSILKDFDEILVMQCGRLMEHGSYPALLDKKGLFYQLLMI